MENRNSLQPIRTAAPADRLLGRVCSVGGRRYLDCGFDQLIAVSDADAARYADGAFVEVEIAAGATPWRDAVSQQQAVQQSFDQLIASIRKHTTLEVGLAAADVERLQSELTAHALRADASGSTPRATAAISRSTRRTARASTSSGCWRASGSKRNAGTIRISTD